MKKRLLKITILISFIAILIGLTGGIDLSRVKSTVRAVGDLSVDWGVPEGDPIFVVVNMAPGDIESRVVEITNNASTARPVGVRGIKTSETGNISSVLNIVISENSTPLYGAGSPTGPKILSEFFAESAGPEGIELLTIGPGDIINLTFEVTFSELADNDFQDKTVIFDLKIGIAFEIPAQCSGIKFFGGPIFGTENNDKIRGTNRNDLILGFEGKDDIQSSNGNDCVMAGPGDDKVNNSNGSDVTFGNEGKDTINGSNAKDRIFGGPDNDTINGSNGVDYLEGNEGDDKIIGNNGNDQILGGIGNDKMEGGNGNDSLIGGLGFDSANGGLGRDTCVAETEINCEL